MCSAHDHRQGKGRVRCGRLGFHCYPGFSGLAVGTFRSSQNGFVNASRKFDKK